jgi:hypothetical protein
MRIENIWLLHINILPTRFQVNMKKLPQIYKELVDQGRSDEASKMLVSLARDLEDCGLTKEKMQEGICGQRELTNKHVLFCKIPQRLTLFLAENWEFQS